MGTYAAQQHQFNLKSHQQYFFHMQQRHQQQYAAQQAAWQAQYNRHSQMQLAAATGQGGPPAVPGQAPGVAPANSTPAPVTAGEAAAQQQSKQNGIPTQEQPTAAPGVAPHNQWAGQQMMYTPQMYHPQVAQYQQSALSPQAQAGQMQSTDHDDYQRPTGGLQGEDFGGKVDDIEPAPVHQVNENGENEPKRQRIV
uniref:Uncharacterized protein n=1 Tax=Cyclophora tenuis TaxID=216820 RepID=A0A7S1CZ54_CYCTE